VIYPFELALGSIVAPTKGCLVSISNGILIPNMAQDVDSYESGTPLKGCLEVFLSRYRFTSRREGMFDPRIQAYPTEDIFGAFSWNGGLHEFGGLFVADEQCDVSGIYPRRRTPTIGHFNANFKRLMDNVLVVVGITKSVHTTNNQSRPQRESHGFVSSFGLDLNCLQSVNGNKNGTYANNYQRPIRPVWWPISRLTFGAIFLFLGGGGLFMTTSGAAGAAGRFSAAFVSVSVLSLCLYGVGGDLLFASSALPLAPLRMRKDRIRNENFIK